MERWIEVTGSTRETLKEKRSGPRPPPPGTTPLSQVASPLKPAEKPAPRTVDFSLPAIGGQNIGRFTVGTRHMPIHPSQEIKEPTTPKSPITPSSLSPIARLGGTIAPSIPTMRESRGPIIHTSSAPHARAGLRNTSGPRRQLPPRDEPYVDPKLKAVMAKRRQWEEEAEDTASNVPSTLITPLQSASNIPTRTSTLTRLPTSGQSPTHAESAASEVTGAAEEAWDEEDDKTIRAKRISRFDFNKNRRTGWGGDRL